VSITSVVEVREWLVALLLGDAALMALMGTDGDAFLGVYDEKPPENAPFGYIVIGGASEIDGPAWIGSGGLDDGEDVRIYTRPLEEGERPGNARGNAIYAEVHRLLHRRSDVELPSGKVLRRARLARITSIREQDGVTTGIPCRFTFHVSDP
jgi:hypothetical protein